MFLLSDFTSIPYSGIIILPAHTGGKLNYSLERGITW